MKLIFAGTPEFAARHLEALIASPHQILAVITQPDKPGKRGKQPVASPVKMMAKTAGLTVIQPRRLRAADIEDYHPDLLVVVAYGQILKNAVLNTPANGCINVHGSLLPRWRGAAPIQRAIMAGDRCTGICIMQMDSGLDTGDIILKREVPIAPTDTSLSMANRLADVGNEALLLALDQIQSGTAERIPQEPTGATYASKISKDEAALDWRRPGNTIAHWINAFNPDPGTHGVINDLRIKFWEALEAEGTAIGAPGEILEISKQGILVACGESAVLLSAIQLPFGKGTVLRGPAIKNAVRELVKPGDAFFLISAI